VKAGSLGSSPPTSGDQGPAGPVEWRLRPRWLLATSALCLAWAAAWVGGFAAVGALDRLPGLAYAVLAPFIATVTAVRGRRLRLTDRGVDYVGGLSRLSVDWADVEALDRRHLTYTLARETTNDTGLKISMDSFVRATPRKHRRIPLRPFLDDRYRLLLARLQEHRPDLLETSAP
jgi:hypothetical protein